MHLLYSLRAINLRNQSRKIVSSSQFKSGDLSIETANSKEVEALKKVVDDCASQIGNGDAFQTPYIRWLTRSPPPY
ncbi:hypothetical protein BS50DRAFT_482300 [Corynespora cassiicola Philippines]|uniref:Uncharacterized protein n=1 Tax=Corynespora cassiicola Philippines TaxID=1448308 RepID=A0A2T2P7Z6_CORCC|nr:hypothetical protein BS50DRAFT_482300 [Corynespora cassiicola Philippines]